MDSTQDMERVRAIQQLWSDGDYAAVGAAFHVVAQRLAADHVRPGMRVLDAATGTGNLAVEAARAGAEVDAFDLTPQLLDQARARADAAGLDIRFVAGDLLDVPFPDTSFDLVGSTFGAFLADDPARCAAELVRVTRPGGRVVTTAWAVGSAFVALGDLMHEAAPDLAPFSGASPWTDQERLTELVAGLGVEADLEEAELWLPFPSADDALAFYERTSGPVRRFVAAVGDQWPQLRVRAVDRWQALARPGPLGVELPGTYAIATITRAT